MKKVYPVIFTQSSHDILVEVPDFDILTQGSDLANAIDMARDAIGLKGIVLEDEKSIIPEPGDLKDINSKQFTFEENGLTFVSMVDVDFTEYRRRNETKSVRRNVTLPNWLNQEADRAKINVSKVLQDALLLKLEELK